MMSLLASPMGFTAPIVPAQPTRATSVRMDTLSDLKELANKCNPVIGYFDPLALGEAGSGSGSGFSEAEAIGFLRHAEIKHGRIAMFAFVGFIVQSNGIHFPWGLTSEISYADISAAGGPADQWDALPTAAKLQILGFIGFLEHFGESSDVLAASGGAHYMRGGKPGFYPKFSDSDVVPHFALSLFDPAGLSKNASPEKKARGLVAEINNGRAAMIGIMGFVAAAVVPGSVPSLDGLITPYAGEVMAPFAAGDASLPFVTEMLKYPHFPHSFVTGSGAF